MKSSLHYYSASSPTSSKWEERWRSKRKKSRTMTFMLWWKHVCACINSEPEKEEESIQLLSLSGWITTNLLCINLSKSVLRYVRVLNWGLGREVSFLRHLCYVLTNGVLKEDTSNDLLNYSLNSLQQQFFEHQSDLNMFIFLL